RVRSAMRNSEVKFPVARITVNLAPADIRKVGPSFDLPMALGILLASGQLEIAPEKLEKALIIGELALNGALRSVNGILPICAEAEKLGFTSIFLPRVNAKEATLVGDLEVYGVEKFSELVAHFAEDGQLQREPTYDISEFTAAEVPGEDFAFIRGQEHAKRALEIAAAGGHNVLMNGTPGSGKTLMARALRSILPALTRREALEVTKIYSIANLLPADTPLVTTRPFRTIHHTASSVSLVGGGKT